MTRIEKKVLSINKIYKNDNYQCILCNDVIPVYLLYLISMVKGARKRRKDIILMISTIWLVSILRVNSCFTKSVKFVEDEETNYIFIVNNRKIHKTIKKYSEEP